MRTFTDLHGRSEPPLPDWDTPQPGEPAHGYVARLGAVNRIRSVRVLLTSHGLNGRDIQPGECLEFALSFPMRGKEALIHSTPVVSPTRVRIMGQEVRRRHWQIGQRRFCPACLSESPHHRVWWDLPAFRRCPHHDLDILFCDPSGHPVPWWSPSFTHAPTGVPLLRHGIPARPSPRPSLESYILGRLGSTGAEAVPLLDGLSSLGDVLDAVEFVGRVAKGGALRSRPIVGVTKGFGADSVDKAGYALLARGEAALVTMLREIAEKRQQGKDRLGKGGLFGWIGAVLAEEDGSHVAMLGAMLRQVIIEQGRFTGAMAEAWAEGAGGWLPAPTLARELGLTEERLRRISETLGIHERQFGAARDRYRAFSADRADLVRRTVASLIDCDAAAEILGLKRCAIAALVNAGLIQPFARIGRRDGFRPEEITAFAERLLGRIPLLHEPQEGLIRLGTLRRTCKTDPSKLIAKIIDGRVEASWRAGPRVGDLMIRDPRRGGKRQGMDAARAALQARPGIGRYEAATRFGCRVEIIDGLLEAGLLRAATRGAGWRRIEAASLEDLCRRRAPVDLFRDAAGPRLGGSALVERLVERGVDVRVLALRDGTRGFVVDRASARAALGLAHDPDDVATGSQTAFEALLRNGIAGQGMFKVVGRNKGLTLASLRGTLGLKLDVSWSAGSVDLHVTRTAVSLHEAPENLHAPRPPRAEPHLVWHEREGRLSASLRLPGNHLTAPDSWQQAVDLLLDGLATVCGVYHPQRLQESSDARAGRFPLLASDEKWMAVPSPKSLLRPRARFGRRARAAVVSCSSDNRAGRPARS